MIATDSHQQNAAYEPTEKHLFFFYLAFIAKKYNL